MVVIHSGSRRWYVTIDPRHRKRLFYYFGTSERIPSEDPVVLWLNGGPGCSSFNGFMYEHGPFNFEAPKMQKSQLRLHLNPYSWSKVSSIIYLDSPAGVGFSYSKNSSDYQTGDIKTACDSHTFLLKWFELHLEFLPNPFFIAGESYPGVYVPTLAFEVANGIDAGAKPVLKLKAHSLGNQIGYLVGNGVTDEEFDGNALVPFAHGMGLISDELFEDDSVATAWLNDEDVRKAIHAEEQSVAGAWELCTGRISFDHDAGSMIKYHKNLTARGYRALIFR
ncbi:hypothetical protein NL676_022107 [Syzygium grande]|nr:hypothetical protein NL676_022107 [Syzygium grande]